MECDRPLRVLCGMCVFATPSRPTPNNNTSESESFPNSQVTYELLCTDRGGGGKKGGRKIKKNHRGQGGPFYFL